MEVDLDKPYAPEPLDFRFFRYSRLALPLLVLILLTFVAVFCLTAWQARSNIQSIRGGIPRELEPPGDDNEAGVKKHRRNLRLTCSIVGIVCSSVLILIFANVAEISPILRAQLNYPFAVMLLINVIIAWVAFGFDMNSERDARWCSNAPHQTKRCESREDLATTCTVFDALVAVFSMLAGILVFVYTFTGDWARERIEYSEGMIGQYDTQPGLIPNGVSTVRKKITFLALVACLISCIILLVFTILLHEARNRYVERDSFNRTVNAQGTDTRPGWPLKNTKLRYATTSGVMLLVLFNLIPLTSRTIAYIIGFLYVLLAIMAFVCFGIDIDTMEEAKRTPCPQGWECVYHPYNATIALEFLGGIFLVAYVIWEFFVSKTKKTEQAE